MSTIGWLYASFGRLTGGDSTAHGRLTLMMFQVPTSLLRSGPLSAEYPPRLPRLDDIDAASLTPRGFFDGRHWEDAQRRRIAETGQAPPPDAHGAKTLQAILDRAPE